MKWENEVMEGKPENVFISKWLPQSDILAHPNMKIFISHCGYGGVVEAKHHGVPIIGIPFAGDQHSNAAKIVQEGWAIQINFNELSEESFMDAILSVLKNPKFSEIVKRLSVLSKDRPMSAKDTAVYWVEYVLRHRGANHLRYPGADLNFLQNNSIDVIGFLALIIFIGFKVLKIIFKFIFCRRKKLKIN
jgi:UDP:flavonoid glycosyltransferase YjiC (YdhE family)